MMLYKNTKSLVRSPDGDTDYFDIATGVLQGDTLAPFLFIITLDYVLRTSLYKHDDLGFTLLKRKSSRYPAKKLTDVDYADDLHSSHCRYHQSCIDSFASSRKCCQRCGPVCECIQNGVFDFQSTRLNSNNICSRDQSC